MKYKHTIELITKDFQDLTKFVDNFKNYSAIPSIELDLALAKLRNIYDILLMLKNSKNYEVSVKTDNSENLSEQKARKSEVMDSREIIEEEKHKEDIIIIEKENNTDKSHNEVQGTEVTTGKPADKAEIEQTTEKISDLSVINIPEKKEEQVSEVISQVKEVEEKKAHNSETVLGEHIKPNQTLVYEKLGTQVVKSDLSSKLQASPIKSITGSIGLNDKFYYIRELFKGNTEEFSLTLGVLDNAHNFNEAYNYLIEHFDWDMESEAVQQLLSLIRRKFITGENV